jgi:hypothetical protein
MLKKICARIIAITLFVFFPHLMFCVSDSQGYEGEGIVYVIKPLGGKAEYLDSGSTVLEGRQVQLTVFKTDVFGFKDTEKIYSDPETFLPVRVERDIKGWFGQENIVEAYDQKDFTVTITKFKKDKKVSEQVLTADGPIHNAILVPFYLRKVPDLKVGWSFIFRLPQKYVATCVSTEEIVVRRKKFFAYHFTAVPDKFEIWISRDEPRLPLKIKGKAGFNYTLLMKSTTSAPLS